MKGLYRAFIVAMILLVALGVGLMVWGMRDHARSPVVPTVPNGIAGSQTAQGERAHAV